LPTPNNAANEDDEQSLNKCIAKFPRPPRLEPAIPSFYTIKTLLCVYRLFQHAKHP
jgi:hypothetical protein